MWYTWLSWRTRKIQVHISLVNDILFLNFAKVISSFRIICNIKKCRKVCSFRFAIKNILNKNGARNKSQNSKNIATWYIQLSWPTRKIYVHIYDIMFLEFHIWIFINFSETMLNRLPSYYIFKISKFHQNGSYDYIALTGRKVT